MLSLLTLTLMLAAEPVAAQISHGTADEAIVLDTARAEFEARFCELGLIGSAPLVGMESEGERQAAAAGEDAEQVASYREARVSGLRRP